MIKEGTEWVWGLGHKPFELYAKIAQIIRPPTLTKSKKVSDDRRMKNILIVTENFTVGGLETYLSGEIRQLTEDGWKVHLAVGKQFDDALLPDGIASITRDLNFEPSQSIENLWETVHCLRKLIRTNKIDLVHAHPFISIFAAFIAAEFERTGFVITLHGPTSIASYSPLHEFLLKQVILPHTPLILAVSEEVAQLVEVYTSPDTVKILPNSIDLSVFSQAAVSHEVPDPRWLVVSRLDEFKIVGIYEFITIAKSLHLPGIVIIGDGPARTTLMGKLADNGLADFVEFLGTKTGVHSYMARFAGVAGMGRVALEGLASKKPVILVGYDGVKGFIKPSNFYQAMKTNFSGRSLENVDEEYFSRSERISDHRNQPAEDLHALVTKECDGRALWLRFEGWTYDLPPPNQTILYDIFTEYSKISMISKEIFLESEKLFRIIGSAVNRKKYYYSILQENHDNTRKKIMDQQYSHQSEYLHEEINERNLIPEFQHRVHIDILREELKEKNLMLQQSEMFRFHESKRADNLERELASIHNSRGWKIATYLHKMRGIFQG